MQRHAPQKPTFTPGIRLSRLPVRTGEEYLEDFYRDLFAGSGPEHDRQQMLRLLDEDVAGGAAARGHAQALDHLETAFRRIDAWTLQGDFLPAADRTELKRRVAHNLLAARPGLDLAEPGDAHPEAGILRQVQAEHAAWQQGWTIGPADAPYGRRSSWVENPGRRESREPMDEQPGSDRPRHPPHQSMDDQPPRPGHELADALRRLGSGVSPDLEAFAADRDPARQQEAQVDATGQKDKEPKREYWFIIPEPGACDRCLAMAEHAYAEQPERPHPNCKCAIVSRHLTEPQARALHRDIARRADAIRAERERVEREKQVARIKANTPAYVNGSRWNKDGDPVEINGKDKNGRPAHRKFQGHALPDKTPGGVKITYGKATPDGPTADQRVTRETRDTVQEVLDDPRVKAAGVTSVNISCTTNGGHEPVSAHYDGRAVDISKVNGDALDKPKDSATPERVKVIQEVVEEKQREGKVVENFGPDRQIRSEDGRPQDAPQQANGHQNHIHISVQQAIQ